MTEHKVSSWLHIRSNVGKKTGNNTIHVLKEKESQLSIKNCPSRKITLQKLRWNKHIPRKANTDNFLLWTNSGWKDMTPDRAKPGEIMNTRKGKHFDNDNK
jgi:hypothetical protein